MAVLSHGPAGPDRALGQPALDVPVHAQPRPGLLPFCFWLPRNGGASAERLPPDPASLRSAIAAHLASLGWPDAEPLRWAITAVDPLRGLQLEGLGLHSDPPSQQGP